MEEQLINNCILDQFINSHEQSYEEFLSTFTYLLKDQGTFIILPGLGLLFHLIGFTDRKFFLVIPIALFSGFVRPDLSGMMARRSRSCPVLASVVNGILEEEERKMIQGCKKSLRKSFSDSDISKGNKRDGFPERSKEKLMSVPPQTPIENKMFINESWKSGYSDGNGLSLSERAQVDHYLETYIDREPCNAGSFVLPGEVEEIETCSPLPLEKSFQQKLKISSVQEPLDNKAEELLGDDVEPFLLDEEFDYDNVALTSKFSEAELMPM